MPSQKLKTTSFLVTCALAGLLIAYHTMKLFQLYFGGELERHSTLINCQSLIRIAILVSLILVVLRVRWSLLAMWLSIGALVGSQIVGHIGAHGFDLSNGQSPFGYFKGFIVPTLITILSFWIAPKRATVPRRDSDTSPDELG